MHADAAPRRCRQPRAPAAGAHRPRQRRLALRFRRQALPRRHQLVVDQPLRPRQPAHQRGVEGPARNARTRHARRLHAPAGGRAFRALVGVDRRRARPRLLRLRRRLGHRDRAEDELSLLAQRRPAREGRIPLPGRQLPRRNGRRAGRHRRRPVQGRLRAAGARRDGRPLARFPPGRSRRNARPTSPAVPPPRSKPTSNNTAKTSPP